MRLVVTGASGMLGQDILACAGARETLALTRAELDVTHLDAVRERISPGDVVINCAAYTGVDDAETHEDEAFAINAIGPENVAIACREAGARLITISTDYVFSGDSIGAIPELAERAPVSAYGRSKAAGEERALAAHPGGTTIVRTAWLYGANGPNFARTMLNLAASRESWQVVNDQHGQPTWTADLAEQLLRLVDVGSPAGIFHGTNAGQATWFDFAQAVLSECGLDPDRITPTDSASFVRPAKRPANSVLGHEAWKTIGLPEMRPWREALSAAVQAGVLTAP